MLAFLCALQLTAAAASAVRFDYDAQRPLDVREDKAETRDGVSVREISYAGAAGNRIGATIVTPPGSGPHPAILFVHWYAPEFPDSNRTQFLGEAVTLARGGAVSLLVDTMWSEPTWFPKRDVAKDFAVSVDQVRELRRALDLLLQQPGADPKRVAYVGHDFGSMFGAVLADVDKRPSAFVLIAGTQSFSDWYLYGRRLEGAARQAVIDELAPLDPAKHVAGAAPAPVLFQFGDKDPFVPRSAADAFVAGAREPKEVRHYDAGHAMNDAAGHERRVWLTERLGLAALQEPTPPVLARLTGTWSGSGQWQGQKVAATLAFEPVLGSSFTRLTYRLTGDVGFEGTAFYRRGKEGQPEATWFDSDAGVYAIAGTETGDALRAVWSAEGKAVGRTTYTLKGDGQLEVVDEIVARDGNYREFGRITYARR